MSKSAAAAATPSGRVDRDIGVQVEDALELLRGPVVGVLVGDHDGDGVGGVGERRGERAGVDEELPAGVFEEQGGVFELRQSHGTRKYPNPPACNSAIIVHYGRSTAHRRRRGQPHGVVRPAPGGRAARDRAAPRRPGTPWSTSGRAEHRAAAPRDRPRRRGRGGRARRRRRRRDGQPRHQHRRRRPTSRSGSFRAEPATTSPTASASRSTTPRPPSTSCSRRCGRRRASSTPGSSATAS